MIIKMLDEGVNRTTGKTFPNASTDPIEKTLKHIIKGWMKKQEMMLSVMKGRDII